MTAPLDILALAHQKAAAGLNVAIVSNNQGESEHLYELFSQFFGVERLGFVEDSYVYLVRGNGLVYFRVGIAEVGTNG